MAPSASVSIGWDQLYGRSLQCHFLPFGDEDPISSCSRWSRCLPRCLPWGQGRKEGREGMGVLQGLSGIYGHRLYPRPRIQDAWWSRFRSQPGKAWIFVWDPGSSTAACPLHCSLFPNQLVYQ